MVFSVDERLYLNYRRDKESHPRLDSWYGHKSRPRWITGKSWTGPEAHEAIGRVLHKYGAIFDTAIDVVPGVDESRIAVACAGKLLPRLESLATVVDTEFGAWRKTRLVFAAP
jgi:hypothetical protein